MVVVPEIVIVGSGFTVTVVEELSEQVPLETITE
jgi:hypothetical protein